MGWWIEKWMGGWEKGHPKISYSHQKAYNFGRIIIYKFWGLIISLGKYCFLWFSLWWNWINRVCILNWIKTNHKEVIRIIKRIEIKQIKMNNSTWIAMKSQMMSNTNESKHINYLVSIRKVNSNWKIIEFFICSC